MASRHPAEFIVHIQLETREDGGLRARCDKIPNFFLSHSDAEQVRKDIIPALTHILGELYGIPMHVTRVPEIDEALDRQSPLPPPVAVRESYLGRIDA